MNSAKIRGQIKRLSLLGTRTTGKELPRAKIRSLAIAARLKAHSKMIHEALDKLIQGEDLSRAEAQAAMEQILSGHASTEQIAALLIALRIKGETVDEVVGFALAMRRHATPIFPAGRKHADEVHR